MTLEEEYKQRRQWFLDRIGKRVFRNRGTCTCEDCKKVERYGLVIKDRIHAIYLNDMESCAMADGTYLHYFDTKKDVKQYEKDIQSPAG